MRRPELRLLRMKELTTIVGLSKASIWRMVKAGEFPSPLKIGAATLWPNDKVNKWVNDKIIQAEEI